jgi:peroxiredoxin Q/BCP
MRRMRASGFLLPAYPACEPAMKIKLIILGIVCILAMSFLSSLFSSASGGKLVDPYPAPQVEAVDQDGRTVTLADIYAQGLTLVYFYPKASTPGCTAQACSLRDAYEDLTKAGVQVVGVSTDTVASQRKFADKQSLPFMLLADPDGKVLKAFGVKTIPVIGYSTRQAFLIKDGKVIWRDEKASTSEQAADVLKVLKEVPGDG